MAINMERAASLLRVVHDSASIGPGLSNLTVEAMAELKAMNDEAMKKQADEKAVADKKAAEEKAKADAEAAAKAKAEAAKNPGIVPPSAGGSAPTVERAI